MRSTKIMLLGIAIMLVSIYIPHEPGFRTAGYELYLLVLGFVLTLIGFFTKEDTKQIDYVRNLANGRTNRECALIGRYCCIRNYVTRKKIVE